MAARDHARRGETESKSMSLSVVPDCDGTPLLSDAMLFSIQRRKSREMSEKGERAPYMGSQTRGSQARGVGIRCVPLCVVFL